MTNERAVRNAARPPKRHYSALTSYRDERIECVCGTVVTAEPDHIIRDRHEPLLVAWADHIGRRLR